jgi:hypothetical protein
MRFNLDDAIYFNPCNNFNTGIVDGVFPASGSFIDVSEFTHFAFLVRAGTLDSELTLQVHQDTSATQTASVKDVTGATLTIADDDDNELKSIEVEAARLDIANSFRYVTLDITGAAGGNDYLDILFLGWNARREPVTQPAAYSEAVVVAG